MYRALFHKLTRFFMLTLFGLFFHALTALAENVFYLDVNNPDLYGEIYHVALGLEFGKDSYVYIPHVSGVTDPGQHLKMLEERLAAAGRTLESTRQELETRIAATTERANDIRKRLGKNELPRASSPAAKGASVSARADEVNALLREKLPPAVRDDLSRAFEEAKRAETILAEARNAVGGHRKAQTFAAFFRQASLGDRIIPIEVERWPGKEKAVEDLKGKVRPDSPKHDPKPFIEPRKRLLSLSTDQFVDAVKDQGSRAMARAQALFFRSGNDPPPDVREFVDKTLLSKLKPGQKGLIIWNRQSGFQPGRNMTEEVMLKIMRQAFQKGDVPMVFGPAVPQEWRQVRDLISTGRVLDATGHWLQKPFANPETSITNQLHIFHYLKSQKRLQGQIGMLGGAMDGIAVSTGLPTVALAADERARGRIDRFAKALGFYQLTSIEEGTTGQTIPPPPAPGLTGRCDSASILGELTAEAP